MKTQLKVAATIVCLMMVLNTFGQLDFTENILISNELNVSGLYVADLNNDNLNDIVSASFDKEIAWWQNLGTGFSTKKVIDNAYNGGMYLHVADVDHDGYNDIIVSGAGVDGNSVVWYRNNGTDFGSWQRGVISNNFPNSHGVYAGDIDKDGDIDVVATSEKSNKISWFDNSSCTGVGTSWVERVVISNFTSSQSVCLADVNNDGFLDIIGASSGLNQIKCMLNNGQSTSWTQVEIDSQIQLPHWLGTLDIDGDGDEDVYATGYLSSEVSWYENDRVNNQWIKHKISGNFSYSLTICAADLDKDGDIDFVGTSAGSSQVVTFDNQGDNVNFFRKVIGSGYAGAWPVHIGDLNNDGFPDAVAGANSTGKIAWFKNNLTTTGQSFVGYSNSSLNIFPVPNSGCFKATIENDYMGEVSARIISGSGQTVYSGVFSKNQNTLELDFNRPALSQGIYLLNLQCGKDCFTKRFEVVR